ncbi:hypothetical protein JCM11491_006211 [Sporobolomyces phaffii]
MAGPNLPRQLEALSLGTTLGGDGKEGGIELAPMKRPGYGTKGRAFPALVNAFEIRPPDITVWHYDVKIGPVNERRPARLNRAIWRQLTSTVNPFESVAVACDGQALAFSPKELAGKKGTWEVNLPDSDGTVSKANKFTVTLTLARLIRLGALKAFAGGKPGTNPSDVMSCIQALNIAVQHAPMLANPSRGASFFLPPGPEGGSSLSQGLEMWRGYYSSLRPGVGKVFVNLDISSQVMYKPGNLATLLIEIGKSRDPRFNENSLNLRNIEPRFAIIAGRLLKNLKITLRVGDRSRNGLRPTRKIRELVNSSARTSMFEIEDGQKTNVFEFFKKNYAVTLSHPDWPCVRVSRTALYPIELCEVDLGQKYGKHLSPQLTTELLRLTTIKPRERMLKLRRGIEAINPRNDVAFGQWQTAITPAPMEVTARLLPAPNVSYSKPIAPRDGAWNLARETRFLKPMRISRWICFVFEDERRFPRNSAMNCISALVQQLTGLGLGVDVAQPRIVHVPRDVGPGDVDQFFRATVRAQGGPAPQLLLCFLPSKPNPYYAAIKMFGDIVVGCATQCALIAKAAEGKAQYWANVALKVNVKLGGRNCSASLGQAVSKPTIIFGADVHHPAPGSLNPSIAGLVASLNPEATDFTCDVSVQNSREELMVDLDEMVYELLMRFKQANPKVKPERLIFIRDGISEGEFARALSYEVELVRKACKRIHPTFKPAITYIITGKKHHISIFPKSPQDGDKNGNVKAGTVVDRVITNPFTFDWYLQSHASLLGTGRSAHYTVLVDDSKFSADVLQELVYNLCYTYARCTRSVSIPAPCYYADLLCARAALLLGAADSDDASSLASGEKEIAAQRLLGEYRARLPYVVVSPESGTPRTQQLIRFCCRNRKIHLLQISKLFYL